MKYIKILLLVLIAALVLWIDLPENLRIKFQAGSLKVDTVINPLKMDVNVFGLKLQKDFKTRLGLDLKGGESSGI